MYAHRRFCCVCYPLAFLAVLQHSPPQLTLPGRHANIITGGSIQVAGGNGAVTMIDESRNSMLEKYREFVRIPSISASREGVDEAASYLVDLMNSVGLRGEMMRSGGNPVVFGEVSNGSGKTVLIYNHYDVQPVDPAGEWSGDPFSAAVRDGRVYGRGSADNKGTLVARLFGIGEVLERDELEVNLKFLFEGEEEIGSPNLESFASENRQKLAADAVVMEGSQVDAGGRPTVTLGVKGLLYVELEEETGRSDLHSSLAAVTNGAPWNLVHALNTIYDGRRVLVDGFYDGVRPLTGEERRLVEAYPLDPEEMLNSCAVRELRSMKREELSYALLAEPTCNIDGLLSGYTGKGSKTVTPRKAMAKLDFRLVPDQDPARLFGLLEQRLRSVGFGGSISQFGMEYPVRTSAGSWVAKAMIESASESYGCEPVVMINGAGTQPMGIFTRTVGIPEGVSAIGVGDNLSRVHAPDESVDIGRFYQAVDHTARFLRAAGGR